MFRIVAMSVALVCALLFVLLLVLPATYVGTYGIVSGTGSDFMTRRASPMFAGFAILLWLARGAERSDLRDAICWALIITFAGIGALSVFEYWRGIADARILVAAVAEFGLAALFVRAFRAS